MRITAISDTHTLHRLIERDLPGGDLILHAGDFTSMGYFGEMRDFCIWYSSLKYTNKLFIAGNHELSLRDSREKAMEILDKYWGNGGCDYLEDELYFIEGEIEKDIKVYGSPWQPEFCNWAFNLPRNGEELRKKWDMIPPDVDILVTHGPPWGHLDIVTGRTDNLGCELLIKRIELIKPKIHIFGHIHSGHGYYFDGVTHFINASVLNEQYRYKNKPVTFDWDPVTNDLKFL